MASLLNMSGGSLLGKGLPYDSEIEYLESINYRNIPAAQRMRISTDFRISSYGFGYEINCMFYKFDYSAYNNGYPLSQGTNLSFLCAQSYICIAVPGKMLYVKNEPTDRYYPSYLKYSWKVNQSTNKYTATVDYKCPQNPSTNFLYTKTDNNAIKPNDAIVYIFNGEKMNSSPAQRIYYVKLYDYETVVMDLIPVRVGTTGYMYDKVSGQLFGNSGTGDFILGPDKTN